MASSVGASGQTHQPGQSPVNMTVKEELFQAADKLIAKLNKQGVTQGRKDIAAPRRRHPPILITMEEYEDYLASAESYAIDRRFKRQQQRDEEEDRFVGKQIDVADILKDVTTRDGRLKKCVHVLFSGAAGMGKTTLLRSIAQDGREGKIEALKGKLILMPDFRIFSSEEEILPSQALLGKMFSDHCSERMEERYQWIMENSENVAFLVDSLDTLPFDLENERPRIGHKEKAPVDAILHNLLSQDLFPKSVLISSSREYKVRNLHPSVRPDRCVLLDGLSTESVDELIDDCLGKEKGIEVKNHIATKCPAIGPLLTIPIFFVLYVIGCVSGELIPETMSGILVTFFLALANSSHVDAKTFQMVLKKLMPLAFEGTRSGQVLFTPEHIKRFGLTPEEASALGILIPQTQGTYLTSKLIQNDRFFLYFNHQTQQECLAALSVLSMSTKEFEVFITGDFNGSNFIVVRRFVYGVLLNDKVLEGAMKITKIPDVQRKKSILLCNLKTTFKAIDDNKSKLLEFFIDLNECKDGVPEIVQPIIQNIDFGGFKLTPSEVQAVSCVMKQCNYLEKVDLRGCNLNEEKMGIISKTLMQSNLKLNKLYVGWNPELGPKGMNSLGKLCKNLEVKVLDAYRCNMKSEHVEKLADGFDDGIIDSLDLEDLPSEPPYTRSLLKLLHHVRLKLNLGYWRINESQRQEIKNKLDEIASPTLTVVFGELGERKVHLKASRVISTPGDEISAEMDRRIKTKSTKYMVVGTKGGSVENFECKITFPSRAFDKDTEVRASVITDFSDCPEGKMPIAPIIECGPPGRLNRPACLEVEHWAFPTGNDVHAEVFRKDNKESDWEFVEKVRIVLHQPITFYTKHFTFFQFVINRATNILSGIRRYFVQFTLQNLVYISGVDQSLACVCCLKNSKVMEDVTQTLTKAHYEPLLPAPETTFAERGENVKITIRCEEPRNLKIRAGEFRIDREIENVFQVDTIATKCKKFNYHSIILANGDLKKFDGVLRFSYSHIAGEDNVQHQIQKVWPIPGRGPSHVVNTFGPIRTDTIMGADHNIQQNQLVRH